MEVMCNVIGCIYLRINVPSENGIGMLGVHVHPDESLPYLQQVMKNLLNAANDISEELNDHFTDTEIKNGS